MRLKPRQTYTRLISAAICVFAVFGNSGEAVLCIGEDGHIAIEVAGNDCCGHSASDVSEIHQTAFAGDYRSGNDDCGSCVDVPLCVGFSRTIISAKKVNHTPSAPGPASWWTVEPSGLSDLGLVSKSFTPSPYFAPLRSIILLT
ncbi:MAG: hypothetical protein ACYS4W_07675 [Planctomycetota bacterium]